MALFIALSCVLALAVLVGVLLPLWRQSRRGAVALGSVLVVMTFALYRMIGTPAGLEEATASTPATLDEALQRLEAELERNPNAAEGWLLLARSYASQERYPEARDAMTQLLQLEQENPDLLVEAAQVRAMADPEKLMDDEAVALLQQALSIAPNHQRAHWYLGIAQRQRGQHAEAAATWEAILPQVDERTAAALHEQINQARTAAGLPLLSETPVAEQATPVAAANTLLTVNVELDPALQAGLAAGDTLFVFARQLEGPPMPVAAKRLPASGFPLSVQLSDDDSPMPTLKLSQLEQVQLVARISRSGSASAQSGDLQASPVIAQPGSDDTYVLRIDQRVP